MVGKLITGFSSFSVVPFPTAEHHCEICSRNFSSANTGDQLNFPLGYQMNRAVRDLSLEKQYLKIHCKVLSASNL